MRSIRFFTLACSMLACSRLARLGHARRFGEEGFDILDPPGLRQWWQRVEEHASVSLAGQARVAQHQHATVAFVADQSTGALFERDYRLRELLVTERVAAVATDRVEPCFEHRIVR